MLKRIAIVLLLSFCLFITPVFGGDIDLESKSLDELISLYTEIYDLVNERIEKATYTLEPRMYLVGTDISPGVYGITCLRIVGRLEGQKLAWFALYKSLYDYMNDECLYSDFIYENKFIYLPLDEGAIFIIDEWVALAERTSSIPPPLPSGENP